MKGRHLLIGAGAAVTAYFGGRYLLRLNRLSNELETETKVSIYAVSVEGIELSIDVKLKNPSGGSIQVKHPFVKMIYDNKTVASSQVKDVNLTIPKFGEVILEPVRIKLGFLSMATTFPALVKRYRETGKLDFVVQTITTINGNLPYTKTDNITLGGGKPA